MASIVKEDIINLVTIGLRTDVTHFPTLITVRYVPLGTSVIDLLNRHLSAGTKLSEAHVLHIFSDVSKAVARLHHRTKPIIHRDLKVN